MMKEWVVTGIFCLVINVIHAQSDSSSYYLKKGQEETAARRFREAEKNFQRASELNPNSTEILMEYAASLLAQNRYAQAREIYLRAEKASPGNQAVIDQLTTLSFNLRKWDDAIRYAGMNKTSPVSYIIGKSYYEQENYTQALTHLNKALQEEPSKADIPYILARTYLEMSNYRQSAANFEKAIALDSSKANWIYEASLVFYAIPDYPKSLQYMKLAGDKGYRRSNDYIQNLGNAYINVKQYDQGIELLKEVLQRKSSDQELLWMIAQAYYDNKNYQEAINHWDTLLGLDKTNARALYMIGLSYQKKGETQKGMQLADRAIEMDPSLKNLRKEMQTGF